MHKSKIYCIHFVFLFFLVGCAQFDTKSLPLILPENFPQDYYQQAAKIPSQMVFQVSSQQSQAVIYVYRGGKLAKLGHDHVVASHDMQGYVLQDRTSGVYRADLFLSVNQLTVDEAELRATAHFDTQPSAADIQGTREHMLESVLEEKQFPFVQIHVDDWNPQQSANEAQVLLTLHGVSKIITVPVVLEVVSEDRVQLTGHFLLNQTDYAIRPYSVMGGLLQVKDQVDIEFSVTASTIKY